MTRERTTDLQIRGIPVSLRDRLRRRAERKGVSMSQYVVDRLQEDLDLPTMDEWLEEVAGIPKSNLRPDFDTAAMMRELDDERAEELIRRVQSSSTRRRRSSSS